MKTGPNGVTSRRLSSRCVRVCLRVCVRTRPTTSWRCVCACVALGPNRKLWLASRGGDLRGLITTEVDPGWSLRPRPWGGGRRTLLLKGGRYFFRGGGAILT